MSVLAENLSAAINTLRDRKVRWPLALENAADIDAGQTVRIGKTPAVAHQAAGRDKLAKVKSGRNRMANRECGELFAPTNEE